VYLEHPMYEGSTLCNFAKQAAMDNILAFADEVPAVMLRKSQELRKLERETRVEKVAKVAAEVAEDSDMDEESDGGDSSKCSVNKVTGTITDGNGIVHTWRRTFEKKSLNKKDSMQRPCSGGCTMKTTMICATCKVYVCILPKCRLVHANNPTRGRDRAKYGFDI
jgi:hypothetical protein